MARQESQLEKDIFEFIHLRQSILRTGPDADPAAVDVLLDQQTATIARLQSELSQLPPGELADYLLALTSILALYSMPAFHSQELDEALGFIRS